MTELIDIVDVDASQRFAKEVVPRARERALSKLVPPPRPLLLLLLLLLEKWNERNDPSPSPPRFPARCFPFHVPINVFYQDIGATTPVKAIDLSLWADLVDAGTLEEINKASRKATEISIEEMSLSGAIELQPLIRCSQNVFINSPSLIFLSVARFLTETSCGSLLLQRSSSTCLWMVWKSQIRPLSSWPCAMAGTWRISPAKV